MQFSMQQLYRFLGQLWVGNSIDGMVENYEKLSSMVGRGAPNLSRGEGFLSGESRRRVEVRRQQIQPCIGFLSNFFVLFKNA